MNEHILYQSKNNITGKLIVLTLLIAITWVATMFVWGVVQDRENRYQDAVNIISEQWSRPQTIAGPIVTIPVEKTSITTTGERVVSNVTLTLLPKDLSYNSNIETTLLKKGVYQTPVYTTNIQGAGNFDLSDITLPTSADTKILWDQATVSINVSDPRGISSLFNLTFGGQQYEMLPSSKFSMLTNDGVHKDIALNPLQTKYQFSFELPLKGSREISFLPLGENTTVEVSSSWNSPSFTGEFLPENRNITADGFTANWKVTSYGKNLPQSWIDTEIIDAATLLSKAFGVGLYQEVDFYTMVDRSTKYSILFISLTFLTFFMYEVLAGFRIHPIQYLFVGLTIALFYLLLLSLAEILGFLFAYLIAAGATTTLITAYCIRILGAQSRAFSITALLCALYTYLYILLLLDQYSLLFGSVLLFGVLATIMYITRNINWYTLTRS